MMVVVVVVVIVVAGGDKYRTSSRMVCLYSLMISTDVNKITKITSRWQFVKFALMYTHFQYHIVYIHARVCTHPPKLTVCVNKEYSTILLTIKT